jgi:hypothetical protein
MNPQVIQQVRQIVGAVEALSDLSRSGVEGLLGVKLVRFDDDPRNTGASLVAGPFQRVTLHEPRPGQPGGLWMLGLEVRDGVDIPLRAFDANFLGPIVDINPDLPPEGTVARGIVGRGRSRVLEFFAGSERLRQVSFRRERESDT